MAPLPRPDLVNSLVLQFFADASGKESIPAHGRVRPRMMQ